MDFRERIRKGLNGDYKGLKNGLNRINKYIFNTQRGCYYLLGGLSGSFKTTFADFILINALEDAEVQGVPINVFYYSFEIDELSKRANWTSVLIYNKYGIVVPPEKIKGLGDFRLNEDEQKLVEDVYDELERLFSKINWVWESTNPTGIYREIWSFMEKRGSFEKESYTDEHGEVKERIVRFIPNDPNEYNILLIDTYQLMKLEGRNGKLFNIKENIDKMSEYGIGLRNIFGLTLFFISQFNQGLSSVDRQRFKEVDISPQQNDFKDSTSPYADADVVIGLMNAHKMDMKTCLGYSINQDFETYNLKWRFLLMKIIKNRLSRDNICIGLFVKPEAGSFEELKPANELTHKDIEQLNKMINGQI